MAGVDVLVVSAGNTTGWRAGAQELYDSVLRAGASAALVTAARSPAVRTFALTDLVQAWAARRAAQRGIAEHDPRAVIYCSITAALLWPRPGAISLDSIAAENRPGRHGVWQRPVERRRLRAAPLVLAWSSRALAPLGGEHPPTAIVPVPVAAPAEPAPVRDLAGVTYAGDPDKRRLGLVLETWARARREGETLVVAGLAPAAALRSGAAGLPGVEVAEPLTGEQFRSLLSRARVFIAAPRREEYGVAALEALAAGCVLVSTPSPGPYPALELARTLDERLVSSDLPRAVRCALDDPAPGYGVRAAGLMEPFTRAAVDRTVKEDVLPRLLARR